MPTILASSAASPGDPETQTKGEILITQVNLGHRCELILGGHRTESGIDKRPTSGEILATFDGLCGDFRSRRSDAGGRAISAYPCEHYPFWEAALGRPLPMGSFGENLTLSGATEHEVHLGTLLRGKEVLLQVSEPRTPCKKLSTFLQAKVSSALLETGRGGYYLRVLEPGHIAAGEQLIAEHPSEAPLLSDFVAHALLEYWDPEKLQTMLDANVSPAWNERLRAKLIRAKQAMGWQGLRSLRVLGTSNNHDAEVVFACARGLSLPPLGHGEGLTFHLRNHPLGRSRQMTTLPHQGPATKEPVDSYRVQFEPGAACFHLGQIVLCHAPHPVYRRETKGTAG